MTSIAGALERVRERIAKAAEAEKRDPSEIRLLAVSKTKPAAFIREAYAAGQRDFGENYLQELQEKSEALSELDAIRWHAIGHLQSNKAKLAARYADYVHTVDSVRIAQALGKQRERWAAVRQARGAVSLPVLIEVNLATEPQKSGCTVEALSDLISAVEQQPFLILRGLMTVPPKREEPRAARAHFERLRELRDCHGGVAKLPELSMGMSHDLEVAIASGATIVRVGTAIFGARAPAQ